MPAKPPQDVKPAFDIERQLARAELGRSLFGEQGERVRVGRFELLRRLGRGAMGTVYEAVDTERGGRVALKLLTQFSANSISRLKREFRSLSAMSHPNLIRLDALFCEAEQWFFSMELIEGMPFDAFIRTAPPTQRDARLRDALRQLTAAVAAIHAHGKLHRDLKPSNVLVTNDGRVVVLDFGLVLDEQFGPESLTQSDIVGTPAYMAPELAAGESASRASDWYAVGAMLFEALTEQLPFAGGLLHLLREKQEREAPDPQAIVASAPEDLCTICTELLRRDPGQRPDGDQMLRALADASEGPHSADEALLRALPTVFVGRERELAALDRAFAETRAGECRVTLVHCASGVGKTAVLDRFAERSSHRALVLRGRCHEQETVPYKVFDGIIDALTPHLLRLPEAEVRGLLPRRVAALLQLFPVLGRVPAVSKVAQAQSRPSDARELRAHAFVAFKELLARLADRSPLIVIVDDLQWGDVDSVRMLTNILAPPEPPALLLVAAYRSDEVESSECLRALLTGDALRVRPEHLELKPLPPEQAQALAQALLRPTSPATEALCASIAEEAHGIPFFISELARHVASDGSAPFERGAAVSLERLVLSRVAGMSQTAQRLLSVLSVAASPLEFPVAAAAAQLSPAAHETWAALRAARLLRLRRGPHGELAETYHDRIGETIVANLSEGERRSLHAALAAALEQCGITDPERLVAHYRGAGDRVRAGEMAVRAGRLAMQKLAFDRAIEQFGYALQLLPLPTCAEYELYRDLGSALAHAGQSSAAGDAFLHAAEHAPQHVIRELRTLAAVSYLGTPTPARGIGLAREVLAEVGFALPSSHAAVIGKYLVGRARLSTRQLTHSALPARRPSPARLNTLRDLAPAFSWVDGAISLLLQTTYLRESLDAGDPTHLMHSLGSEVVAFAVFGGPRNERKALEYSAKLEQVATQLGTSHARAVVHMVEANRLLWTGRAYRDALQEAAKAGELLAPEPATLAWERTSVPLMQVIGFGFTGEQSKFEAVVNEHVGDAREDRFVTMMLSACRPYVELVHDRPATALSMLENIRADYQSSFHLRNNWAFRMAEVLSYAGRSLEGFEVGEEVWPAVKASDMRHSEYLRATWAYYRGRGALAAYLESGEPRALAAVRDAIATLPDANNSHGAYRAAFLGALHASEGRISSAVSLLQLSRERFVGCQADGLVRMVDRCRAAIAGNADEVQEIDRAIIATGVVNPERWAWTYLPTPR